MTRKLASEALVVVTCLAAPVFAVCGEPADSRLETGDRIRVTAPSVQEGRVTGTLVAMDDAILTVRPEKAERQMEIPRTFIAQLDVLRGKKRCTTRGALIGAAAGAALMPLYFSGENDLSDNSGTSDVIGGFAFFLLPPTAAGALLGTAFRQDRWVRTTAAPQIASQQRIVMNVTIRF